MPADVESTPPRYRPLAIDGAARMDDPAEDQSGSGTPGSPSRKGGPTRWTRHGMGVLTNTASTAECAHPAQPTGYLLVNAHTDVRDAVRGEVQYSMPSGAGACTYCEVAVCPGVRWRGTPSTATRFKVGRVVVPTTLLRGMTILRATATAAFAFRARW